jgi:hypothetical protein
VLDDGTAWCWRRNDNGELGDGSGGQLGDGRSGQAPKATTHVRVVGLATKEVEVTVGAGATCARDESNRIWCWGSRALGLLGDGTTGITPSAIAPRGCP